MDDEIDALEQRPPCDRRAEVADRDPFDTGDARRRATACCPQSVAAGDEVVKQMPADEAAGPGEQDAFAAHGRTRLREKRRRRAPVSVNAASKQPS